MEEKTMEDMQKEALSFAQKAKRFLYQASLKKSLLRRAKYEKKAERAFQKCQEICDRIKEASEA